MVWNCLLFSAVTAYGLAVCLYMCVYIQVFPERARIVMTSRLSQSHMKCLLCFHSHDPSSLRSNCLTLIRTRILFSRSLWREKSQKGMLKQIEQSEHSTEWLAQHITAQEQSYTLPSCIWPFHNMLDSNNIFFLFGDYFYFLVASNQGCSHHGPHLNHAL